MSQPIARLVTPAQMVAALPLQLGYVPTESLVVACCHEPRGRMGLTMRFDLPREDHEGLLVDDVVRRVRQEEATRVVVAVYTDEQDGQQRARRAMVDDLRGELDDLIVTEAVLVRNGRFFSYLCDKESCCPAAGTPVDAARASASVQLIEAETVLTGRVTLPDRKALEQALAGPTFLAAQAAGQRCEVALTLLSDAMAEMGRDRAGAASLLLWGTALEAFRSPPGELGDQEATTLAVSLLDVWVRDDLAARPDHELPALRALLEELVRRTPAPYDAPVCTLLAWLTYCEGGGAAVTILLDRALQTDPTYSLAHILHQAMLGQLKPAQLRQLTRASRYLERRAS